MNGTQISADCLNLFCRLQNVSVGKLANSVNGLLERKSMKYILIINDLWITRLVHNSWYMKNLDTIDYFKGNSIIHYKFLI